MEKFSFGKNWNRFIKKYLTLDKIEYAKMSLEEFLGKGTISGKTFLDVGCGSGLFSLSALELQAKEVVSFDVDENCVQITQHIKKLYPEYSDRWSVMSGSILDDKFIESLPDFDIVYAWGVLHHTGHLWKAIQNTSHKVKKNGLLFLAIYNNVDGLLGSKFWLLEKRIFNTLPEFCKIILECLFVINYFLFEMANRRNPITRIRNFSKTQRGMNFFVDVRDWLGGYPYEFATKSEIENFLKKFGFELIKFIPAEEKSASKLGNNQFLFVKL